MKLDLGLLILRITTGVTMLLAHGWSKLINFSEISLQFPDPIGMGASISLALAVFAEVFCAALISLGLLTRFAAIPLLITMLVAAFVVHGADPFSRKELALFYAANCIVLFFTGPGSFSLDRFVLKKQV